MFMAGRCTEQSLEFRYLGFGANGAGVYENVQEKCSFPTLRKLKLESSHIM